MIWGKKKGKFYARDGRYYIWFPARLKDGRWAFREWVWRYWDDRYCYIENGFFAGAWRYRTISTMDADVLSTSYDPPGAAVL